MIKGLFNPQDYETFLLDLKNRIRSAQVKAALAVNRELVLLYWQIGHDILIRQQQEGWGAKVIQSLSRDLKQEFPEMKGFSRSNLLYMRAFAQAFPDKQIVQEVLGQITWYHNVALLDKLKSNQILPDTGFSIPAKQYPMRQNHRCLARAFE